MKKISVFIPLLISCLLASCGENNTQNQSNSDSKDIVVSSLTVSATTNSIGVGERVYVTRTYSPNNATLPNVEWYTTNSSVLKISEKYNYSCYFEGVSQGTAKVYAKALDGSNVKSNEFTITVSPYYQVELSATTLGFRNGLNTGTKTLTFNGDTYKVAYRNVSYDPSNGSFSLSFCNGLLYTEDESYIQIGGLAKNNDSFKKIKITAKSKVTSGSNHFILDKLYPGSANSTDNFIYYGNSGGVGYCSFSNSNEVEKGLVGSNEYIASVGIRAGDDGIDLPLTKIELRMEHYNK